MSLILPPDFKLQLPPIDTASKVFEAFLRIDDFLGDQRHEVIREVQVMIANYLKQHGRENLSAGLTTRSRMRLESFAHTLYL
jgi:hypothetical protein